MDIIIIIDKYNTIEKVIKIINTYGINA